MKMVIFRGEWLVWLLLSLVAADAYADKPLTRGTPQLEQIYETAIGKYGFLVNDRVPRPINRGRVLVGTDHLTLKDNGVEFAVRLNQVNSELSETSYGGWSFLERKSDAAMTGKDVANALGVLGLLIPGFETPELKTEFIGAIASKLRNGPNTKVPPMTLDSGLSLKFESVEFADGGSRVTIFFAFPPDEP